MYLARTEYNIDVEQQIYIVFRTFHVNLGKCFSSFIYTFSTIKKYVNGTMLFAILNNTYTRSAKNNNALCLMKIDK